MKGGLQRLNESWKILYSVRIMTIELKMLVVVKFGFSIVVCNLAVLSHKSMINHVLNSFFFS